MRLPRELQRGTQKGTNPGTIFPAATAPEGRSYENSYIRQRPFIGGAFRLPRMARRAQAKRRDMAQELTRKRSTLSGRARLLASNPSWHWLPLAPILVLSAFLSLYGLSSDEYANNYYAAAVK